MTTFKTLMLLFCMLLVKTGSAQTQFIASGRIEFEKKVNIHKEIEDAHWLDGVKDKIPKYRTSYHYLYFKDGKTLFEKGKEVDEKIPFMDDDRSVEDVIYTDIKQGVFAKKQNVFDETFLVSDSIRRIKWQMTNDVMTIAGFECHKAVAIILDSVYVIGFYTDQITVNGGPLSLCNLPGMILGIAVPRMNMSIFATKVEMIEPKPEKMIAPLGKMKKTDYKGLSLQLQKALSDWGSYGKKYILSSML